MKVVIDRKEATRICSEALFKYVADQGYKDISCEAWSLNCKRKGIVFKGTQDGDDKLDETEKSGRQRDGTGKYVPAEGKRCQ